MKLKYYKTELLLKQGELLREERKRAGYTLTQVTDKLGRSKSWLSDIEAGRNDIFFVDVTKLADLYGADVNDWARRLSE